ncbi:MAG: GNAT family N-acetyltransferase [Gammaproteobacteria bacterium]|nr:GNAT family N-acetyltransferase [Gammaproteobacteria bacterium]
MEFACYTDWAPLPDGITALFAHAERQSLFHSRPWFENLAENAAAPGHRLLLACVEEHGEPLAVLPLWTAEDGNWRALSSYYTSLFTVLLADGCRRNAVIDCLAAGLAGTAMQTLRLEPVADHDPDMAQLRQALDRHGYDYQRLFHFVNWSHRLRGQSFEQYLAQRPSRLRNTIARKRRKLEREHDVGIRLYTDGDLEQAIADYGVVYKASWKDGERFTRFVPTLLRTMAGAGWLRLGILYIDGQPAAAQIWFVVHGMASIFRLVYDERWQQYSPGSILTAHLAQHVIDIDHVQSIDFLTGNERYKQDWMQDRGERWRLVFVRRGQRAPGRGLLARWLGRLRGVTPHDPTEHPPTGN